ncbi:Uncharacterised protein [Enterobacter hormaechei]|nr:hypothetical protein BZY71_24355 [Leclercia adecarboxylata]VAE21264.1 Uncharacterised protein [Enterobacter hormaechei]VAE26935.1 Uncharacterised protein [Enterobacter hormaechei]
MAGETMHFAHEVFSIEKLLANADDATLEYMFSQPHDEVRSQLREKLASGIVITTNSVCTNFCPEKGCLGHEVPDDWCF